MNTETKIKLTGAATKLSMSVQDTVNGHADDYDDGARGYLDDLMKGGCQSGIVGELVYYHDTLKFYNSHKTEIGKLITELVESTGESIHNLLRDFDKSDPLCLDINNQNLLAWFGFEETARNLANLNDIEL